MTFRGAACATLLILSVACSELTEEELSSECTLQAAGSEDGYVEFEAQLAIPTYANHRGANRAIKLGVPECEWVLNALMASATIDAIFKQADDEDFPPISDGYFRFAKAEVFAYKFVRTDGAHAIFVTGVYDLKPDVARTQKFEEDLAILRSQSDQ